MFVKGLCLLLKSKKWYSSLKCRILGNALLKYLFYEVGMVSKHDYHICVNVGHKLIDAQYNGADF